MEGSVKTANINSRSLRSGDSPLPRRFVILDRDGTITVERYQHVLNEEDLELIPGAAMALARLQADGFGLVVVTNQSVIGSGSLSMKGLDSIHQKLVGLLKAEGVTLDGIYTCPHIPSDGCDCRKPKTGLVERAARELGFDPRTSFVVGDKASDMELGQRVGAITVLVRTGYGSKVAADAKNVPDYVVDDLRSAARVIESAH